MAKVPNVVETLPKISTAWGRTSVTDRRQTDEWAIAYSEREREFMFAKNTCSNFVTPINRWYSTSRHIVYCFCRSRVSVTLSTKSTKFGSRYLVDRLSEVDEIWQIVSSEIAVHQCRDWWTSAQEILHGAPKYWSIKRNAFLVYIVWLSAMKFGSVRGLVNRHFVRGPAIPCGDADALIVNVLDLVIVISILCSTLALPTEIWVYGPNEILHFWWLRGPASRGFAAIPILPGAKFTLRPSLAFPKYWQCYGTALQQRASAKLRRRTRNGITELSQTAPPIFCRGYHVGHRYIGPHSSFINVSTFEPFIRRCSQCHVTPCRVLYLRRFFTIDDSTPRDVAWSRVAYFKSNLKHFMAVEPNALC